MVMSLGDIGYVKKNNGNKLSELLSQTSHLSGMQ